MDDPRLHPVQTDMAVLARGLVLHAAPHQALQLVQGVLASTGRATARQTADPRWLLDGGHSVIGLEATPTGCILSVHELAMVGLAPQGAPMWEWVRANIEAAATASGVPTSHHTHRFVHAQVIDPSTSLWRAAPADHTAAAHAAATGRPAQQTWPPTPTYAPASGSGTEVKVAVAIISIVVGVVILGILAAIAIPVFLDQQQKAALAELDSLTCEDVGASAVDLSAEGAAASGMIALVAMTDAVVVADQRATLQFPDNGSRVFVMTCDGTGTWADGLATPLTVDVYVDSALTPILELAWDE